MRQKGICMKSKNILSKFTLGVVTITLGVTGCAGTGEQFNTSSGSVEKMTVATTESVEVVETEEMQSEVSMQPITYEYEQELNIIDDNYRNYYEIFVYSFCDSDGDGIGDLNGVIEKLDYVQDMGFNGIWLMPIMQSTTYHKYDVTDYYKIDSEYGSMEDFERLVEECHKRDIDIIIDFVMNHSSSKHQWFVEACEYLKELPVDAQMDASVCPFVDYYHFTKEKLNNTYYPVAGTDWYYEGSFWEGMPDLNWENGIIKKEFEDIAEFWIGKGIDGFRMDAVLHFSETDKQLNIDVMNWFYTYCQSLKSDFYMVSEVWAGLATITDYYASKTPSMFNFDGADTEGKIIKTARGNYNAEKFVNTMLTYQTDFGEKFDGYIDAPFIGNHDTGRIANSLNMNENDMKMAAGLLMTMSGNPFIYYGEEIGMSSSGKKDENKRLPMIWSNADMTGMTKGPKDADAGIKSSFAPVDEQLKDETSILNYYKRGIRLRNENPELARGTIALVEEVCDGHQAVITKTYEDSVIAVAYNTSDEEIKISIAETEVAGMGIRGYLTLQGEVITLQDGILSMPAQSICILK